MYEGCSFGVVSELVDEELRLFPVSQLRFVFTLLIEKTIVHGFDEICVVAAVWLEMLRVEVINIGWHFVQELSVVRYHEQGRFPSLE